jgi:hypothetical protein
VKRTVKARHLKMGKEWSESLEDGGKTKWWSKFMVGTVGFSHLSLRLLSKFTESACRQRTRKNLSAEEITGLVQ